MRILVPKGSNRDVERGGCYGIQMPDGTTYNADRRGYIDVNNSKHLDQIKNSRAAQDVGLRVDQASFRVKKQDKTCPRCSFSAHLWQKKCPRDGAELETS